MTNKEYLILALNDEIDDGGAAREAFIHYNIACPYTLGDERALCRSRTRRMSRETPMPVQDAQQALIEEIADVRVMLFVLEKMLDTDGRVRLIEQTAAKDRRMTERLLGE